VLSLTLEPLHGFVLQGFVSAKQDAGSAAAAAADTFFSIHIDGTLLIQNGTHCADRLCKA